MNNDSNNTNRNNNSNEINSNQPSASNSRKQTDDTLNNAGSKALQGMGLPKGAADNAAKNDGGVASPGNLPANKIIKDKARDALAKGLDSIKGNSNNKNNNDQNFGSKLLSGMKNTVSPNRGVDNNSMPFNNLQNRNNNRSFDNLLEDEENSNVEETQEERPSLVNGAKNVLSRSIGGSTTNSKGNANFNFNVIGSLFLKHKIILGIILGAIALFVVIFVVIILSNIKKFDPIFASDDAKDTIIDNNYARNDDEDFDYDDIDTAEYFADDDVSVEVYKNIKKVAKKYGNNERSVRRMLASVYMVIREYEDDFNEKDFVDFDNGKIKKLAKIVNKSLNSKINAETGETDDEIEEDEDDEEEEEESPANNSSSSSSSSSGTIPRNTTGRIIWVGDSRFQQMFMILKEDSDYQKIFTGYGDDEDFWVCKGGEGYNWFDTQAVDIVTKNLKPGDTIVINMGGNGFGAEKYIKRINALAEGDWSGYDIVFMTVNPWYEGKAPVTNADTEKFNNEMKEGLSSSIKFLDTYSELYPEISTDPSLTDGMGAHYNQRNMKEINQFIYDAGRNGATTSGRGSGYDRAWLKKQLKKYFKSLGKDITSAQAGRMADEAIQNVEDYKSIIGEEPNMCDARISSADPSSAQQARFTEYDGYGGGAIGSYDPYVNEGTITFKDGFAFWKGGTTNKANGKVYGEPGKEYMIVATATEYLISQNGSYCPWRGCSPAVWPRDENIKYFEYGDTFTISVGLSGKEDEREDYNAIVLDSCGACMEWSFSAASKGMSLYTPQKPGEIERCKVSEGYKIDLCNTKKGPSKADMGYIMDGTTGNSCVGEIDLGELVLGSSDTTALTTKTMLQVYGEDGIEELNKLIDKNVSEYGKGTGKGAAAAAITLINSMKSKGYRIWYDWGGGHGDTFQGVNKDWGLAGKGLDCSGFVSWAIRNGGCTNFTSSTTFYFPPGPSSSYPGKVISASQAKAGDILNSWNSHILLVVQNNGDDVILAESTGGVGLQYTSCKTSWYCNNPEYKFIDMTDFYNSSYCR